MGSSKSSKPPDREPLVEIMPDIGGGDKTRKKHRRSGREGNILAGSLMSRVVEAARWKQSLGG